MFESATKPMSDAFKQACAQERLVDIDRLYTGEGQDINLADVVAFIANVGAVKSMRYFVDRYNADVHDDEDWALFLAVDQGHLDMARYLVEEKGADVQAADNIALRTAASRDNDQLGRYLIKFGANKDILSYGHPAFHAKCKIWEQEFKQHSAKVTQTTKQVMR